MKVKSNCLERSDQQVWPPGFRFHPTDEELVMYYLKRKICRRRLELDIIAETDVYKWDPEELPGKSKLRSGDRQWFFFTPRDRRYPNGARSNRATQHGYWKATGKDRNVTCNSRTVGVKKTLVYYKGRAPNGERTDWVMHEYTLDEEELKRCKTAMEYYALYKVFKKSGPGPKNGEQYGAIFNEDEWVDDDVSEVPFFIVDQENSVKQLNEIVPLDILKVDSQLKSPLNNTDGMIIWPIINEPTVQMPPPAPPLPIVESTLELTQVFGDFVHETMADSSVKELNFTERSTVLTRSCQQFYEASEATSASNIYPPNHQTMADDFFDFNVEDFLEIEDLNGLEPTPINSQNPIENLQFDALDGLSEFDIFHDASMFVRCMGPTDYGTASHPYSNNLLNDTLSQLDFEDPFDPNGANQFNGQLWTHDTTTTGVLCSDSSANKAPNQNEQINESNQNWFTSALWDFVESIPTTPASASESALVNRAFERMSSFGRLQINASNISVANMSNASVRAAEVIKSRSISFLFSVLVVFFSIFIWVLMNGKTGFVLRR